MSKHMRNSTNSVEENKNDEYIDELDDENFEDVLERINDPDYAKTVYEIVDGEIILKEGHFWAEDVLNELFGDDPKKRQGNVIRGARSKDGLSRREAAIRLGITPKELKLIEKGLKNPSKRLTVKMGILYGVGMKTLWDYAD